VVDVGRSIRSGRVADGGILALLPYLPAAFRALVRELERGATGRVCVRFVRSVPPYNSGETAGFDRDQAERFVKAGVAHFYRRRDRVASWWRDFSRLGS
jgi:hypothetical protein